MWYFYGKKIEEKSTNSIIAFVKPKNDLADEKTRYLKCLSWEIWRLEADLLNVRDMSSSLFYYIC